MREMIRDRQTTEVQDKHDLFSSLIHANKEETEVSSLAEDELMGEHLSILVCIASNGPSFREYFHLPGCRA
jgi:hypothetical protein